MYLGSLFATPSPASIIWRMIDDGHSDWSDMILHSVILTRASLVAQLVKNLLVMQETPV